MKHFLFIVLFLFGLHNFVAGQASSSIIKDLNTAKSGEGTVKVYQDETISGLIGSKSSSTTPASENSSDVTSSKPETTSVNDVSANTNGKSEGYSSGNFIRTKGYKIQAFSSNEQRARGEAESRKSRIASTYPDLEVLMSYNPPVWRVRVGNFKTYEQALQTLKEMKNIFPSFGRELQIVEDVIKLPVE